MNEKRKPLAKQETSAQWISRRGFAAAVVATIAVTAALLGWLWSRSGRASSPAPTTPLALSPSTNLVVGQAQTRPAFQKLAGSWIRPDGGYVLQIKNVDSVGVMDAAYFNPDPIHVSKAVAFIEGGRVRLFIELKDVNYPGCTYTLEYDPVSDHMAGDYFQAALQQHFDVEFTRKP